MASVRKNQESILKKLGIEKLNPMQEAAQMAIQANPEVVLLSPTGTGKTLAFLLPIITGLDPDLHEVQVLILAPSRELAIQIDQVIREMGSGFKNNVVYGGRPIAKDKIDLKHPPAILIGTPGRIADHLRRKTFSTKHITSLVLDEFDKSLEIGFEGEMSEIAEALPHVWKKILTSATQKVEIPSFLRLKKPMYVDFLEEAKPQIQLKVILSPDKDKLETLVKALSHIGNKPGIVFCNYKDSIQRVSEYLQEKNISHGCFYGGMEQKDRERALIKFRNGTHQLIIATDLAARGIDVPEIQFILHYHLPIKAHEFIHRNGRTARMNRNGVAYILQWQQEALPDFVKGASIEQVFPAPIPAPSPWETVFISGGRKDKISKGDIAGLFFKQAQLSKEQFGIIELKQDCAFVAVKASEAKRLVLLLDHSRLKKKKVRLRIV